MSFGKWVDNDFCIFCLSDRQDEGEVVVVGSAGAGSAGPSCAAFFIGNSEVKGS